MRRGDGGSAALQGCLGKPMKAIRVHEFGGPAVLTLEDLPDPKPGPGEVVVRVRAAGVNPVDAYIHSGTYAGKPPLPYTPGQDAAVELAHARGLTVIGSGGTDKGLAAVREHGAHMVVNHREANYTDAIVNATSGRGVNVIVEMAAHVNLDRDLGLLAKFGRVVVV